MVFDLIPDSMYSLQLAANQMLPPVSATNPCGPESGVLRGYSFILPVIGSTLPYVEEVA